jgi:hypothetical protein
LSTSARRSTPLASSFPSAVAPASPHEQHPAPPELEHHDQRVLVDLVRDAVLERLGRREEPQRHPVVGAPHLARPRHAHPRPPLMRRRQRIRIRVAAVRLPAVREQVRPQRAEHRGRAADMIAVGK